MPIYEYECGKCGEVFEVTQRISDAPLKKHDVCGSKKVKKLISQSSFQLKGGGWYVTDYTNKKTDPKPEEKPAEAKSDDKKDKKTESSDKGEKPTGEKKTDDKKPGKKKDKSAA